MSDSRSTDTLYCKISPSDVEGRYENISTTMTNDYLREGLEKIISLLGRYEVREPRNLDVRETTKEVMFRLGNIRRNIEDYRLMVAVFGEDTGFRGFLRDFALNVVGYPETWYQEFDSFAFNNRLHEFVSYTVKRDNSIACMNFDYDKYLSVTKLDEELQECDCDKARFYHDMTLLVIIIMELSGRSRFLNVATSTEMREILEKFREIIRFIPVTGMKCWVYYKLEGCSANDVFYELTNLYSENKRFVPHIKLHDDKKIIRLKTRTNDDYGSFYFNYLHVKGTPEEDEPSNVHTQTEVSMGKGRTPDELAVSVRFTGMNIISKVLSTSAKTTENVRISNMTDYIGFSVVNMVSFYFRFLLNSLVQIGAYKFSYLTAFEKFINGYKSKRNVPLNTLTAFALVQLSENARLNLISKYYSSTREQEKAELIRDCAVLERKFNKIRRQEEEMSLYKQLLFYLEKYYAW